jgi:hypothetical protein
MHASNYYCSYYNSYNPTHSSHTSITTVYSDPQNQMAVQIRISFSLLSSEILLGLCSALYNNKELG